MSSPTLEEVILRSAKKLKKEDTGYDNDSAPMLPTPATVSATSAVPSLATKPEPWSTYQPMPNPLYLPRSGTAAILALVALLVYVTAMPCSQLQLGWFPAATKAWLFAAAAAAMQRIHGGTALVRRWAAQVSLYALLTRQLRRTICE